MTRALNSYGDGSLMLRAVAGNSSGKNLTTLGNKSLKLVYILIINTGSGLIRTESANLLLSARHSLLHRSILIILFSVLIVRVSAPL